MCSHVKEVAVTVHVLGEERNQKICFEASALCDLSGRGMLNSEQGEMQTTHIIMINLERKKTESAERSNVSAHILRRNT